MKKLKNVQNYFDSICLCLILFERLEYLTWIKLFTLFFKDDNDNILSMGGCLYQNPAFIKHSISASSWSLSDDEGDGDETLSIKAAPKVFCLDRLGRLWLWVGACWVDWENHEGRLNEDVLKPSSGMMSRVIDLWTNKTLSAEFWDSFLLKLQYLKKLTTYHLLPIV